MSSIYHKTPVFYYPFSKPLLGNINDLCSNPSKYDCNLNNTYSSTNCGEGYKPVIDCGINSNGVTSSAICCPEKIFPYAKVTKYCTYLNNQGCFKHQKYSWPHSQGIISNSIPCPPDTYDISDCGLCCPKDITNGINFTSNAYNPSVDGSIIGNLWNKDNANLEDGFYKISYENSCVVNLIDSEIPTLYQSNSEFGDCGGIWKITKIKERYIGKGIYPSADLKYTPGGYTLYNTITKKYLVMKNLDFVSDVKLTTVDKPSVVLIYKNVDGTYRIENARNQIASFSGNGLGNIGNPIKCAVVDENSKFDSYNWGNGLVGLPCGINNQTDQNNYKFHFERVDYINQQNIPATLKNGIYYITDNSTDKCINYDGIISNAKGTSGVCGTILPRFKLDTEYRWILKNEPGNKFTLQNEINGNFLDVPVFDKLINTTSTKTLLDIYVNTDGSMRIMNGNICIISTNNELKGYNWGIGTMECGTGSNSTINSYKLNFVIAQDIIIPPVSVIGKGTYEIGINGGQIFDQNSDVLGITNYYGVVIENKDQKRWIILESKDKFGNNGYTIQNIFTNRYLEVSNDPNKILGTNPEKTVLYIYLSSNSYPGSYYTIQNFEGTCLYLNSNNFTGKRWELSQNACGLQEPSSEVLYTLKYINPSQTMQTLSGNGGNCNYTWYNTDLSKIEVSGFSDEVSCNEAITVAKQNAEMLDIENIDGKWFPFFNDEDFHIFYTYGGKCLSADSNGNVLASSTCTKNNPYASVPSVDKEWYWKIVTEKNSNGIATGNYYIINQLTNQYLTVPNIASTSKLVTTTLQTPISIKLTYPTFDQEISKNKLRPTSYYFHFTSPEQVCIYSNNIIVQSVKWGSNTGLISEYPIAPIEQQQRQIMYECGKDPTKFTTTDAIYNVPNPNYQFTVNDYCLNDYKTKTCFHDDGSIYN